MYPQPFTVQRIRRTKSGENALKQPVYSDSVSTVAVYGWQPVSEVERYTAALAGRTVTDLKLLSPTGDFLPTDAVVIGGAVTIVDGKAEVTGGGAKYEVDGQVEDYNHGPFGFTPGYAIGLRRVANA